MFTHDDIWRAIDRLAEDKGFSPSGLARQAGLDATAFNRSKRTSPNGKPRWPSTESLSKILTITACSTDDFMRLMAKDGAGRTNAVPMLAQDAVSAGKIDGHTDAPLFRIAFTAGRTAFAVTLEDNALHPLYRAGSVLVADPGAKLSSDDRILLYSPGRGLKGGILYTAQRRMVSVLLPDQDFREVSFPENEIEWMARILWASQ